MEEPNFVNSIEGNIMVLNTITNYVSLLCHSIIHIILGYL